MCLRLSHLFRLYPLYLLLAAALLGVAVVASPVPRANTATAQRRSILLRIGHYDWEHRQWEQNCDGTTGGQCLKVLCIGDSRCFGYTPTNDLEWIAPKTVKRLQETKVKHVLYRTMKAYVYPLLFNRAQQSLYKSLSSVATLQAAIKERIRIEDDESCIRAILDLMVEKGIVIEYDGQQSLEENMKPVQIKTISKLRFGFYDWSKGSWVGKNVGIKPNFLCLPCSRMCLGFDEQGSTVREIQPQYYSISTDKRNTDPDRHPTLVYKFDNQELGDWSDPDHKDRTLVQFLQDTGDLNKAAGGDIKDPESYIRAVLRYLSLDSVGIIRGYDSKKPLSDLVNIPKRKKGGDGQDVGDEEIKRIKGGDDQDVRDGGDHTGVDNAGIAQETGRLTHEDGQVVRGGQEVGGGHRDRTANNAGTEVNNADTVHSASKSASIHNLIN
ncbi:hypothetical protein DFJ43DRAFT_170761 [Lentinula guzmanii]|uniref:Uncharacterized protein n=1 Tax=Lentinula guzmanii TaxID=2804957 RepID=A0AA38JKZ1_9AGAR|nr:hypothetical protein DFJ43DRAFT_170761 [Lentinula guzmanii]